MRVYVTLDGTSNQNRSISKVRNIVSCSLRLGARRQVPWHRCRTCRIEPRWPIEDRLRAQVERRRQQRFQRVLARHQLMRGFHPDEPAIAPIERGWVNRGDVKNVKRRTLAEHSGADEDPCRQAFHYFLTGGVTGFVGVEGSSSNLMTDSALNCL